MRQGLGVVQGRQVMAAQVQLHQLRVAVSPMLVVAAVERLIMLAIIRGVQPLVVVVLGKAAALAMVLQVLLIQAAVVVAVALK
tara:strand:- start:141 stop:389 length:249 start_codon:yes stop_codon:yes gene_type:complete